MNNLILPRVLVVGINPWREDGTAHTLKNIFTCWDPQNLALVYTRSGLPYTNVASRFFQISEDQVLKNLHKPWVQVGKEVQCTKEVDLAITKDEEQRYKKAHERHSFFMTLCREIVWLLGHWRSRALNSFIADFAPDLLFIPIYPTVYMSWIQRYIIRKTKKPFVCYCADDNYSYVSCKGLLSRIHRFWLRKNVRWLSEHCSQMYVIVEKEKEETDKLFGTNSVILSKSIDFSNRPFVLPKINRPINFVYTGSLIIGRDKTLAIIADAINDLNKDGIRAVLNIYSKDEPVSDIMARLNAGASCHKGFISRDKIDEVQQNADVVIFAEAIEGKDADIARLSFSTKITDYLANGKCIFAVGKRDIAPIDYFIRNDSAIIAHTKQEVYSQIEGMITDPYIIKEYSRKSYECAIRNHEKTKMDKRFIDTMLNVLR